MTYSSGNEIFTLYIKLHRSANLQIIKNALLEDKRQKRKVTKRNV